MSLCFAVCTPEGIALAGDSRQTQVVNNVNRVGSDNAEKVFQLTDRVMAATAGWAFLKAPNQDFMRNIASLMADVQTTIPAGATVKDIAVHVWEQFNARYQDHIAHFQNDVLPAGRIAVSFLVVGFNADSRRGELYFINVPSDVEPDAPQVNTDNGGWWCVGTNDVVSRIIYGYDGAALGLPAIAAANAANNNANVIGNALGGLGYNINWTVMTLQDAVDFAVAMIQVTTTVQRFTAGTHLQMGAAANVGGPIDVAVVRPGGTVEWVARKKLHV